MNKIYVKYCFVDVEKDNFEKGIMDYVQSYTLNIDGVYNSIESIVNTLQNYGFSENIKDYFFFDGNGGELIADKLENVDGNEPTLEEIKQWKEGKINLYNARLSCGIELIETKSITSEMAKDFGLDIA